MNGIGTLPIDSSYVSDIFGSSVTIAHQRRAPSPAVERIKTMEKKSFQIANISCGHCVAAIQRELGEVDGIVRIDGDPDAKSVTVQWESPATETGIKEKLTEIGYPANA